MNTPATVAPREEFVELSDVRLFTRTVGSGPAVIVLHGGPGAHHDYMLPQFDLLANGRSLKYYDQRGGGQSPVDRDTPIGWRNHVDDLAALIDRWELKRAPIIGYSWGGLLAMLFATIYPEFVSQLALVSPAPATAKGRASFEKRFIERSNAPEIVAARDALRSSDLRLQDPEAYKQRAFELSVAGYFRDPEKVTNLTPFRVTGRTQQGVWESLGDYDIRNELVPLEIPSIVLHGKFDPIPMATAEDTAQILGAPLVVLENSGHVPYVEDTEKFVSVLDEFLPNVADQS